MIQCAVIILILAAGYYTFTYGKSLWVDDHNKLGAAGAVLLALLASAASLLFVFFN